MTATDIGLRQQGLQLRAKASIHLGQRHCLQLLGQIT